MIIELVLSLIPIGCAGLLAALISGGAVSGVLDLPDFLGVTLVFIACIFISGYGKAFIRIFYTKKKFEELSLEQLQKTELALNLAAKILMYSALFIPFLCFINVLYNTPFESIEMHSLGPNSAVQFTSVVYLCLFEMMIYTCKAKVRKSIILYMAEVDEAAMSETKITGKKIVKLVIGVILLLVIAGVYLWENIPHYINQRDAVRAIIDLPSFLIIVIFTVPLIAISGNLKNLWGAIKTVFSNTKINIAQKNLYLNVVKTTEILNWLGAISATVIGWIGMMYNLEDESLLYPNLAVSLITLFYAVLINFLFMVVETRVNSAAE